MRTRTQLATRPSRIAPITAAVGTVMLAVAAMPHPVVAADHGDTPLLTSLGRSDAKLTDLHVFTRGDALVLALSTNPAVPPWATAYVFPADLRLDILIDRHSEVSYADETANAVYGGTVVNPLEISADVGLALRFKADGRPKLKVDGIPGKYRRRIRLFAGLRDDPFIRGPRQGRNVGSIVIELPLAAVVGERGNLLIWAVSRIEGFHGGFQDLAGRALRSMFSENDLMNTTFPALHPAVMGVVPDVVLFDTSRPAAFPNGRDLGDDVVDLVGDARVLANDAPFPTTNDRRFLGEFPYLATPHPPR